MISSVVSVSVARALPSARRGKSPRVMRHCLAGCSPLQVQVRLSVVSTGTATVSTGMLGLYLATSRAVEPPLVSTTMRDALTCTRKSSLNIEYLAVLDSSPTYNMHGLSLLCSRRHIIAEDSQACACN